MSGRKNNLPPFRVLSSVSMSGTVTSSVTNLSQLDNIGVQFNFTGSPVGTFNVQVSNDYNESNQGGAVVVLNPGSWINMSLTPSPAATGTADNIYIDIVPTSAQWIRTVYTGSSGTGVLSYYISGKML